MATYTLEHFTLKFRENDGKAYFTVSDLKSLPEWPESPLLELIKGELYLMPSPNTNHQNIAGELFFQIKSYLKSNQVGFVFTAPYDVILSEEDTIIPDIIFVSKNNEKIVTSQNIQGSPDFIIEVVSSNRSRDFIQKRNLYEEYGIREYWIVDKDEKRIYKYLLNKELRYETPQEYDMGSPLQVTTIPGLSLTI